MSETGKVSLEWVAFEETGYSDSGNRVTLLLLIHERN